MWENVGQLASAYKIGRAESAATLALLQHIDEPVVEQLTLLVKCPGFW